MDRITDILPDTIRKIDEYYRSSLCNTPYLTVLFTLAGSSILQYLWMCVTVNKIFSKIETTIRAGANEILEFSDDEIHLPDSPKRKKGKVQINNPGKIKVTQIKNSDPIRKNNCRLDLATFYLNSEKQNEESVELEVHTRSKKYQIKIKDTSSFKEWLVNSIPGFRSFNNTPITGKIQSKRKYLVFVLGITFIVMTNLLAYQNYHTLNNLANYFDLSLNIYPRSIDLDPCVETICPTCPVSEAITTECPICSSKEELCSICPTKEQLCSICPTKEQLCPICPTKEQLCPICPSKEQLCSICPSKEELCPLCPTKEELCPICPIKECPICEVCTITRPCKECIISPPCPECTPIQDECPKCKSCSQMEQSRKREKKPKVLTTILSFVCLCLTAVFLTKNVNILPRINRNILQQANRNIFTRVNRNIFTRVNRNMLPNIPQINANFLPNLPRVNANMLHDRLQQPIRNIRGIFGF